jgi:phosphate/sulfate permease
MAGCFVASAAIIGTLVLVFLVVLALRPPTWVQVVIGVALAVGGATFAWLIASALAGHKSEEKS